jgi:hypothetical protein
MQGGAFDERRRATKDHSDRAFIQASIWRCCIDVAVHAIAVRFFAGVIPWRITKR